jgi:hypothetical protein
VFPLLARFSYTTWLSASVSSHAFTLSLCPIPDLFCSSCRFYISFVVLIIYEARTCPHCKRVWCSYFYLLLYDISTVLAVRPYPACLALYFLLLLRSHLSIAYITVWIFKS